MEEKRIPVLTFWRPDELHHWLNQQKRCDNCDHLLEFWRNNDYGEGAVCAIRDCNCADHYPEG